MKFTIIGAPITKKNHMRILRTREGKPFIAQAERHEEWADAAILQLQAQVARHRRSDPACTPITVHVNLEAHVYRYREGGDLGNYLAAVCDALERAGVVENDRLIAGFDGSRLHIDQQNPRVEIELVPA